MIENILKDFGLKDKEITIYLSLLKYGTSSTSLLAKRSSMNRGTTFLILKDLADKGLVTKSTKNKIQYHTPIAPKYLKSILEKKKNDLNNIESGLNQIIPILESMRNPMSPIPKIEFFEGKDALRNQLEDTLRSKDDTLFAIIPAQDAYDMFGKEYFDDYTQRRIKSGKILHVIRDKNKEPKGLWPEGEKYGRKLRFLPKGMSFETNMWLYDDKVSFFSSEKEGFGIIVQSSAIHTFQMKLFETLWEICVK